MVRGRGKQWSDPRNRNSITTTLPVKLESMVVLPPGSLMVNSGDLRGNEAAGKAKDDAATIRIRTMDVMFRIVTVLFLSRSVVFALAYPLCFFVSSVVERVCFCFSITQLQRTQLPNLQLICFHLSTMRWTSAVAMLMASMELRSPLATLRNIRGTTKVLKASIKAGLAGPGTPRLWVQCSASFSAPDFPTGSPLGSLARRTTKSGTVFL